MYWASVLDKPLYTLALVVMVRFPNFPSHLMRGIPGAVRRQLFERGCKPAGCVVCGRDHDIHYCIEKQSAEGRLLRAAWQRKWILLLSQELSLFAQTASVEQYILRSNAVFVRTPLDQLAVCLYAASLTVAGQSSAQQQRRRGDHNGHRSEARRPEWKRRRLELVSQYAGIGFNSSF